MRELSINDDELTLLISNDPNRIIASLEDMFHVHSERYEPRKYCINIKVHCLPLTWRQEQKALGNLEEIWDIFMRPWISDFKAQTGHQIFSEGRCGGYLYVDGVSEVEEPDDMVEVEEDDDGGELPQITGRMRERLMILLKFKNEWGTLLKDIKGWLNTRPMPKDEV
jgi:hypothetical protein